MKYVIQILTVIFIFIFGFTIVAEVSIVLKPNENSSYFLLLLYLILFALVIANIFKAFFYYLYFKEISMLRVLPFLLIGIMLFVAYYLEANIVACCSVLVLLQIASIIVEYLTFVEIKRAKQIGTIL